MRFAICVVGVLAFVGAAVGQDQPQADLPLPSPPAAKQPAPAAAAPSKYAVATRADLAQLYIRFERTFRDYPPPPEKLAEVNKAFDAATLQYFGGGYAPAIKAMNELTDSLRYKGEAPAGAKFASSLKVSVEPVVAKFGDTIEITVSQLYAADPAPGPVLRVDRGKGENSILAPIGSGNLWREVNLPPVAAAAEFQVYSNDEACFTARVFAANETFELARSRLTNMLMGAKENSPAMVQAVAACRSRIGVLQDKPSTVDSAQFLANPVLLRDDIATEIGKLQRGVDPYARRVGDLWRTINAAGIQVPCRVYAPAAAADSTTPHPLLIALHGAGGDESMFLEGYGAGRLRQLADKHGLIVVSPLTYLVMGNAAAFDGIVEAIGLNYTIDPKRVYVLGHSMGGGAAAGLAMERPDAIAAACCMAGTGRFTTAAKLPPTLLIAGELDPLVTPERVKSGADAAAKAGLPVEYREAKNYGHTLLVGGKLDESLEWLIAHKRE